MRASIPTARGKSPFRRTRRGIQRAVGRRFSRHGAGGCSASPASVARQAAALGGRCAGFAERGAARSSAACRRPAFASSCRSALHAFERARRVALHQRRPAGQQLLASSTLAGEEVHRLCRRLAARGFGRHVAGADDQRLVGVGGRGGDAGSPSRAGGRRRRRARSKVSGRGAPGPSAPPPPARPARPAPARRPSAPAGGRAGAAVRPGSALDVFLNQEGCRRRFASNTGIDVRVREPAHGARLVEPARARPRRCLREALDRDLASSHRSCASQYRGPGAAAEFALQLEPAQPLRQARDPFIGKRGRRRRRALPGLDFEAGATGGSGSAASGATPEGAKPWLATGALVSRCCSASAVPSGRCRARGRSVQHHALQRARHRGAGSATASIASLAALPPGAASRRRCRRRAPAPAG